MAMPFIASSSGPGMASGHGVTVERGRLLVDGSPRRLRGVAVGDPILLRHDRVAETDYGRLAHEWKCGIVRISVHPGVWKADRVAARERLDTDVRAARALGMAVIIDWHTIGWPDGPYEIPQPDWGLPEDVYDSGIELAAQFWEETSARYAYDTAIVFELWNEPVRLDAPDLERGTGGDWSALRVVWLELVERIRRNCANTILLTGGNWAADLSGVASAPIEDSNIAYAWHVYPGTDRGDGDSLETLLGGVPAFAPVVVTEWGFADAEGHLKGDADTFGEPFRRAFLDGHCLHWTAWCWGPYWQPYMLEPDWQTETDFGRFVRRALQASDRSACDTPRDGAKYP